MSMRVLERGWAYLREVYAYQALLKFLEHVDPGEGWVVENPSQAISCWEQGMGLCVIESPLSCVGSKGGACMSSISRSEGGGCVSLKPKEM
jgi:hypothetical protein